MQSDNNNTKGCVIVRTGKGEGKKGEGETTWQLTANAEGVYLID